MRTFRNFCFKLLLFFGILVSFSCESNKQVQFPVSVANARLLANSREARKGTLDFSNQRKLEFWFEDSFAVMPDSSLQIQYEFSFPPNQTIREKYSLILDTGTASWELPMDVSGIFYYAIPIENDFKKFTITLAPGEKIGKNDAPVFMIRSIGFSGRWFGFTLLGNDCIFTSPFVYRRDNGSYMIDVPASFLPNPFYTIIDASFSSAQIVLEIAGRRIETFPGAKSITIPPALYPASGQTALFGDEIESFVLFVFQDTIDFPKPIKADPAFVLDWPQENWRNADYEIFHWERFRFISLLILDFADYAVQDRMLKRLAFFVEKAGFRGRLASDTEIAHLHGWNAHDYRADDLARFFDLARKTGFHLSDEERQLEKILLDEEIIKEEADGITAGYGGIISISRESPDYLRYRLMAHEGFHGLFFIDEDFRNFSRLRWEQLSVTAKRFITAFFDFQQYDTQNDYLLVNEFMSHILQQPVSQAADYFGRQLPQRLESSWRSYVLPAKNEASGTWPELAAAFTAEAEAFSSYVNQRWGLTAGRVWSLHVN
jgi:hypothetical protein